MVISAQRGFRNSTGFWFWGIPNIQHYISVRCGKDSACQYSIHKRCGFDSRVGKNPWSRKWQPSPVFLPQKFHGQRSLSSVQSLSRVQLFATPCTAACQASLSNTNSQSLFTLMSIESMMPSTPPWTVWKGREAWRATIHGVTKLTTTEHVAHTASGVPFNDLIFVFIAKWSPH